MTENNKRPTTIKIDNTVEKMTLYNKIEEELPKNTGLDGFEVLRNMSGDPDKFYEKIRDKDFTIDKYTKQRKQIPKVKKKKIMSSKFKKERKLFDIPKDKVKYEAFLGLNKAWNEYIIELLAGDKFQDNILQKLLKADYHGALVKVLQAKCKSYEGKSGIVLMETMRAFRIVTTENRILTILKQNSVFLVEVMGKNVKIYGVHLQVRPADRMRIKYKMKYLDEIISNKKDIAEL